MNAFIVQLENRPGELARVTAAIGSRGINITSISGATSGETGAIAILSNDESGTRRALQESNCSFRELEVVPDSMEDRPGALAEATQRLADAGVNIESVIPIGMAGGRVTVGFVTAQAQEARNALGEKVTPSSR
ncbi:MAG TPA: ACT domain-containing protein [Candidatus Limnocylindrales bacterium]